MICSENREKASDFQSRLPFHDICKDPWQMIEQELTPKSFPFLFQLVAPLDMDSDDFYCLLVQKMIHSEVRKQFCNLILRNQSIALQITKDI